MASNHKLTSVLKGRTVQSVENGDGSLTVSFDDGSVMSVKTAGEAAAGAGGGTVKSVRQQDTTLSLDFEDGSTLEIRTAEPTSSVMVRDGSGALEYVD